MPIYEYACEHCEHTFEELVFGTEQVECPQCQTNKVQRKLSRPARPQTMPDLSMACNPEGPS